MVAGPDRWACNGLISNGGMREEGEGWPVNGVVEEELEANG